MKQHYKNFGYEILQTLPLKEGLEFIAAIPCKKRFGRKQMLAALALNDPKCVCCKVVGTKVCQGKRQNDNSLHWDVYTDDDTALTIDHITPRSKGGADKLENAQLLCKTCNEAKGNRMEVYIAYKLLIDLGIKPTVTTSGFGAYFTFGDQCSRLNDRAYVKVRHILRQEPMCGKWQYHVRNFEPAVVTKTGEEVMVAWHWLHDYQFTDLNGTTYHLKELSGLHPGYYNTKIPL
jgi:hypothetical protein